MFVCLYARSFACSCLLVRLRACCSLFGGSLVCLLLLLLSPACLSFSSCPFMDCINTIHTVAIKKASGLVRRRKLRYYNNNKYDTRGIMTLHVSLVGQNQRDTDKKERVYVIIPGKTLHAKYTLTSIYNIIYHNMDKLESKAGQRE